MTDIRSDILSDAELLKLEAQDENDIRTGRFSSARTKLAAHNVALRRRSDRLDAIENAARALDRALSLCRDDSVRDSSPAGNPYAVGPHHGRHLMVAHDALRQALRREP